MSCVLIEVLLVTDVTRRRCLMPTPRRAPHGEANYRTLGNANH